MSSTGIQVTEEVLDAFNQVKAGNCRYAISCINEDHTEVVLEKLGDASKDYKDFCGELPSDGCRYGFVDYQYKTKDGRDTSKMIFFVWAPDAAPIKSKMMITSRKDAVKKKLIGIGVELGVTDFDELEPSGFEDKLN
mmetsp:Transcript_2115/g.3020  ORF Transcript_2115/g.3020 Transcript_2115/m.3020 type:complete len:137 (+) Transcript_2115:29-439(+)